MLANIYNETCSQLEEHNIGHNVASGIIGENIATVEKIQEVAKTLPEKYQQLKDAISETTVPICSFHYINPHTVVDQCISGEPQTTTTISKTNLDKRLRPPVTIDVEEPLPRIDMFEFNVAQVFIKNTEYYNNVDHVFDLFLPFARGNKYEDYEIDHITQYFRNTKPFIFNADITIRDSLTQRFIDNVKGYLKWSESVKIKLADQVLKLTPEINVNVATTNDPNTSVFTNTYNIYADLTGICSNLEPISNVIFENTTNSTSTNHTLIAGILTGIASIVGMAYLYGKKYDKFVPPVYIPMSSQVGKTVGYQNASQQQQQPQSQYQQQSQLQQQLQPQPQSQQLQPQSQQLQPQSQQLQPQLQPQSQYQQQLQYQDGDDNQYPITNLTDQDFLGLDLGDYAAHVLEKYSFEQVTKINENNPKSQIQLPLDKRNLPIKLRDKKNLPRGTIIFHKGISTEIP